MNCDAVYRERAHLLAHLTTVYPSHIQPDPADPDWPVLYITFPPGVQCTWHISSDDLALFDHVRTDTYETWDGHTTDEKYERITRATHLRAAGTWKS